MTINLSADMMSFSSMKARVSVGVGMDATVEQRLDVVERNLERLSKEVGELDSSLESHLKEMNKKLAEEAKERRQRDEQLSKRMADTLTHGTAMEALGVWFFVVGVVFGTASQELARLF